MKRFIIILLSFILAFVLTEFIVTKIAGYPKKKGQNKFVYAPHIYNNEVLKWKAPYTEYWTVEGNNKVYRYNNLGLPGKDVFINDSSKIVFMLGDSFLEAMQVPPEKMAVSEFSKLLTGTEFKPLNLGAPNNDAYILWFRTNFFERYYKPSYVCLLVTCLEVLDLNFKNHSGSFDFRIPQNFGEEIPESRIEKISNIFRNNSAVINLTVNGFNSFYTNKNKNSNEVLVNPDVTRYNDDVLRLKECLIKYKEKYGDKFFVVSMEPEEENNKLLSSVCGTLNIEYTRKNLLTEENILKDGSHLNERGNQKLGELFYDAFIKVYKK